MKTAPSALIRLLVLVLLLLTASAAFAQDAVDSDSSAIPFMGIRYTGVDEGLFLTGVIPNTPAAAANLQPFDIVSAVNGNPIAVDTVRELVWIYAPGESITLSVLRNGATQERALTLMDRPDDVFNSPDYPMPLDMASIGLYVGECNDHLLIVGAHEGSQVAEAGFQMYDKIVEIDGSAVSNIPQGDAAVADLSAGDELAFVIMRGDRELVVKTVVEDLRRNPAPRQSMPARVIDSRYTTDPISLGYGDDFVQVLALDSGHPLYAAGLRANDVITRVNNEPVAETDSFFDSERLTLTVERPAGSLSFDAPGSAAALLMFAQDTPAEQDASQFLDLHEKRVSLGVRYIQLEPDSDRFGNSGISNGAYVVEVIAGLPADAAGIREGDIIVAVAGEPVTMEIDLRNRIYFQEPGEVVTLDVLRDGVVAQVQATMRVAQ